MPDAKRQLKRAISNAADQTLSSKGTHDSNRDLLSPIVTRDAISSETKSSSPKAEIPDTNAQRKQPPASSTPKAVEKSTTVSQVPKIAQTTSNAKLDHSDNDIALDTQRSSKDASPAASKRKSNALKPNPDTSASASVASQPANDIPTSDSMNIATNKAVSKASDTSSSTTGGGPVKQVQSECTADGAKATSSSEPMQGNSESKKTIAMKIKNAAGKESPVEVTDETAPTKPMKHSPNSQLGRKTEDEYVGDEPTRIDSEESELEGEHLLMESSNEVILPAYTRETEDEEDALTAPASTATSFVQSELPTSLHGYGKALLQQAESEICSGMLMFKGKYLWREYLPRTSETTIHNLMNCFHEMQLKGEVYSAVCVRFGPAYKELQNELDKVELSPLQTDRSFQTKKLYDAYTMKRLRPLCTTGCIISINELETFLTRCQAVISLIHIQLQRCANVIAKIKAEKFSVIEVLRSCGLPLITSYHADLFVSHYNIDAKSLLQLVEAVKQHAARLEEESYMKLIKCIRVLQGPVDAHQDHVLTALERNSTIGGVAVSYKLTTPFLRALETLCSNSSVSDWKSATITANDMCALLYPNLMSVRCLTPIGTIIISHKLSPRSTITECVTLLNNKFQLKFRQIFSHEKMPTDMRYYLSDATKEKLDEIVPSDRILCSAFCEVQHIIIESTYTHDLYEAKLAATEAAGRSSKPASATVELTPEATVRTLQQPNVIELPKIKKFPYAAHTCHNWSVVIMNEYLATVIELPQYEENFLRYEINGYGFLCLDNKLCQKTCGIDNPLHAAKVSLHAEKLRKKVFSSAMKALPDDMTHWHPIHIAAYVSSMELWSAALVILRRQLDGSTLLTMSHEGLVSQLQTTCSAPEVENTVVVLNTLKKKYYKTPTLPKPPSKQSEKETKIVKKSTKTTAMKARRLKEQEQEQQQQQDILQPEIQSDDDSVVFNDFDDDEDLPPVYESDDADEKSREHVDIVHDVGETEPLIRAAPEKDTFEAPPAREPSKAKKSNKRSKTVSLPAPLVEAPPVPPLVHQTTVEKSSVNTDSEAMEHVKSLRKIVDQHAAIVKQLKNENKLLIKEKLSIKNKLRQIELDSLHAKESAEHAVQERDEAIKALSYVSEKFVQEVKYDSTIVGDEIEDTVPPVQKEKPTIKHKVLSTAAPVAPPTNDISPPKRDLSHARVESSDPTVTLREMQQDIPMPSINLVQSLESESKTEIKRWKTALKSIVIALAPPVDTDTTKFLRSVSLGWIRAGRSIYARSQGEDDKMLAACYSGLVQCGDAWLKGISDHGKHNNPYTGYISYCYASAIAYRILRKFSGETLHVAHLLQQMREGVLPSGELSRTDFSEFLSDQFQCNESWHDLDALYQKLDPDRNGFISLEHAIVNMQDLLPYGGFYLTLQERQQAMLLLLTIITCYIANQKSTMDNVIQQLLLSNLDVPSFRAYAENNLTSNLSEMRFLSDLFYLMVNPFFEELKLVAGQCSKIIKFLSADLKGSCSMLVHMLRPTGDIAAYLSTVIVTYIEFRIKLLSQQETVSKRSLLQQLQITLSTVIGVSRAKIMEERASNIPLLDFEMAVADMLGIPLPHGTDATPLMTCQGSVEDMFLDVASAVLRHRREPAEHLTRLDTRSSRRVASTRYDNTAEADIVQRQAPSPTKSIDPIELYLECLNEKSHRRRKILKGLLDVYRQVSSIKKHGVAGDVYASFDDLLKRSRGLQTLLLRDMQAKLSTRDQQIEDQARHLLSKSSAHASKQAMEVESVEQSILQVNEDALLLIEKIERELKQ